MYFKSFFLSQQDELKTAMELMGEELTDEDIDNMIAMADLNKDGKIDYEGNLPISTTNITTKISMQNTILL